MKIAIYSRKSKQADQGDSIANQIAMCKDYAAAHFADCEFFIYRDEGFSGGNTDRPMFKKLIKDIGSKKFDVLVCYRLDRISRNVANFAETLEILNKHGVGFVSIKEQFNTTTPMGKAMMYISSVFAQLERDTIAERITDNLSALAKTGRFLGNITPQGYKKLRKNDHDGKQYNILAPDENEVGKIQMFFERYLEVQSLSKLEVQFRSEGIKTRNNKHYTPSSIKRILCHPVYAAADKRTYEYFKGQGCEVYDPPEKWGGTKGVQIYRYSKQYDEPKNWLIGVGEHEPLITSQRWIQVQEIIVNRKALTYRRPFGGIGLLNGILRCKNCGDYMRPASISGKTGHFYYKCCTKELSRALQCSIKNIRGDIFDKDIVEELRTLLKTNSNFLDGLQRRKQKSEKTAEKNKSEAAKHKAEIVKNEKIIESLVMRLAESGDNTVDKYISDQIKKLDERSSFLQRELLSLENKKEVLEVESLNIEIVNEAIAKINNPIFDENEFTIRRNILKTLIEKILWDGDGAEAIFYS